MARTVCSIDIARPAEDILEFILDVERYRVVDPRLSSIRWVRRASGCTVFQFRPALMGLPAPLSTQMVVRRDNEIEIRPLPGPNDLVAGFVGGLRCENLGGLTRVIRSLHFELRAPLRQVLDGPLQRWLDDDVPAELTRLKTYLEKPDVSHG